MTVRRESASYLQALYESIWRRLGASKEEARVFARCFVRADLRGKDTQGIACIPLVYPWIGRGAIRFGAPMTIVEEGPSFAVIDGGRGPGQVVATRAMELAIRKAGESIMGCVWVRNSTDFTMAANYSMLALEHDYVGLAMSNGVPLVAPWGGRDPVFNTSPFSFAVPAGSQKPIVFDGSMSSVSHGKVVLAARDRVSMPGSPLVGPDGRATDDPVPLIVDPYDRNSEQLGAILPLGPKGLGWLVLVDVFAGIMSGGSTAKGVPFHPSEKEPWSGGFFLMAINPGRLMPLKVFKEKVDKLIRDIKASRPADGFSQIVLPGERALMEEERRLKEGVPIREEHWDKVMSIAKEVGLDPEALRGERELVE